MKLRKTWATESSLKKKLTDNFVVKIYDTKERTQNLFDLFEKVYLLIKSSLNKEK